MANLIFDGVLGQVAYYGGLPQTNDGLLAVLLSGTVEPDATLRTYTDLATLLGSNTEQTTMGRQALTSVAVTSGNPTVVDADDVTWTGAAGADIVALLVCYDPDTTTGTDSDIIPIAKFDWAVTPSGSDVTAVWADVASGGIFNASAG